MLSATDEEEELLIAELLATNSYRLGLEAHLAGPQQGSTHYTRQRLLQAVKAAEEKCKWLRAVIRLLQEG